MTPIGSTLRLVLGRLSLAGSLLLLTACGQSRVDDSLSTIVVGGDVNHSAVHELKKARGRNPTREELLELHRVWIDNEILYREGLKLSGISVDAGASQREQLIASTLAAIDLKVRPTTAPEDELRRYFKGHRDAYEHPALFDFEDASPSGQPSEATIRALTEKLNADRSAAPDDLRVFKGRPESNLQQSYGADVTAALAQAPLGKWQPLHTRDSWRALRVVARTPKSAADFTAQRDAIRRDWIETQVSTKRAAAVQALWKGYKIEVAPAFECHAEN